jgi:hypothetical protein
MLFLYGNLFHLLQKVPPLLEYLSLFIKSFYGIARVNSWMVKKVSCGVTKWCKWIGTGLEKKCYFYREKTLEQCH